MVGNTALPKDLMLKLGKESKVSLKTLARFVSVSDKQTTVRPNIHRGV